MKGGRGVSQAPQPKNLGGDAGVSAELEVEVESAAVEFV